VAKHVNLLLVFVEEHAGKGFERFFDILALHGTSLEELEADLLCERLSVARINLLPAFEVRFVGDHDTGEVLSVVLGLNLIVPRAQQLE
jgi:hypothetical protein